MEGLADRNHPRTQSFGTVQHASGRRMLASIRAMVDGRFAGGGETARYESLMVMFGPPAGASSNQRAVTVLVSV